MKKKAFTIIEISAAVLILALLIVGFAKSSRFIREFKINSARSITEGSPVASTPDLVAWWETTSEKSISTNEAVNGGTVSAWNNINSQSFSNIYMTQSNSSLRPIYNKESINGLPTLSFDGTTQYLETPYNAALNPSKLTFFAVARVNAISSHQAIFSSRNATSTQKGYIIYFQPAGNETIWLGSPGSWNETLNVFTMATGKATIITHRFSGSTLYSSLKDGTSSYSQTSNFSNSFVPNPDMNSRIGAGRNESTPTFYFGGDIAEIIIFNEALSYEEINNIEKYLGKKWGIKVN